MGLGYKLTKYNYMVYIHNPISVINHRKFLDPTIYISTHHVVIHGMEKNL